jgi:tetratricopeptide (TPR) repeat protein
VQTRSQNSKALILFREQRYAAARASFESQSNPVELISVSGLFYAVSCHETGDTGLAIELLNKISDADNSSLSYHSNWYLALIYIDTEQWKEALDSLHRIANVEGQHRKKAKKLIRKLS